MKKLLLIFVLLSLLINQTTLAYALTKVDTKIANNKIKILNERIKKGSSYEIIYKQQLSLQNNIKKIRDNKNVKSIAYKNLDKNYIILQYILENLINYGAVKQNIVSNLPVKIEDTIIREQTVIKKQNCENGWYYNEGAMSCQPNNPTRSCNISNGIGKEIWNGNNWNTCNISSCNTGYSISNGKCLINQSTQQANPANNQITCSSDQHIENNTCTSNIKSCTISNGVSQQSWTSDAWSSCIVSSCNSGYSLSDGSCTVIPPTCSSDQHIENNTCLPNTRNCSISNGYASQTWSSGIWGSCNLTSCGYGFIQENNTCKYTKPYLIQFQDNIGNIFTNNFGSKNTAFIPKYTDNYKSIGTIKQGDTLSIKINTLHPLNESILCYYTFGYEQGSALNGLGGGLTSKSLTECNSSLEINKTIGEGKQIIFRLIIKAGALTNMDQIYNIGSGDDSIVMAYDIIQ